MAMSESEVFTLHQLYRKRAVIQEAITTVTKPGSAQEMWSKVAALMTAGSGSISQMSWAISDGGDMDNWLKEAALARLQTLLHETVAAIHTAGGEV